MNIGDIDSLLVGGKKSRLPKKPKKRKSISKGLREKVWFKYMKNKIQGKCYCCNIKPIHFTEFEVGHNKSVYSGGTNHINNLRPICRSCNREMGTKSIESWKNKYYSKPKVKKKIKKKIVRQKSRNPFEIEPIKIRRFGI